MRVIIAAGGTGGHIYPGVAIAREFKRRDPATEILFVGTPRGLESKIVPSEGFALELIEVGALKGVSLFAKIKSLVGLPLSFVTASSSDAPLRGVTSAVSSVFPASSFSRATWMMKSRALIPALAAGLSLTTETIWIASQKNPPDDFKLSPIH